jgi:hypothetical protein
MLIDSRMIHAAAIVFATIVGACVLLELAASHPLPELPVGAEKEVRDAARIVITGAMANAGAPQAH